MPDDAVRLNWTEEQWTSVNCRVQEMAAKARVASSCLPVVGPLPPGQATVPALTTTVGPLPPWYGPASSRLNIDDGNVLRLTTLSANVYLRSQQAEDPELTSAMQMLGRAADVVGRLEDAIAFRGQPAPGTPPPGLALPVIYDVGGGQANIGLLDPSITALPGVADGPTLVDAVADAIQQIENSGHFGPFACILGRTFYQYAIAPAPSLAVARDSLVPLLDGGCLRRCSVIPPNAGVVVALGGSPVDLVVATDVHVTFLQISTEPRYVLRVSERVVLRIKDREAVRRLTP
jgi:uncharacterized linocin/CFP29 family protein